MKDHDAGLLGALREVVAGRRDAVRAAQQQAYMKSALPFQGWPAPELEKAVRPVLRSHPLSENVEWEWTARTLWDEATVREHWYVALALLRHRNYRRWRDPDLLPLLRHLVESGTWWDVVDQIASHLVGDVLDRYPSTTTPVLREWSRDDGLWVRRTAILSQLGRKDRADRDLLTQVLDANLSDSPHGSEFFIRKAVGWALRDLARSDPGWVRDYVTSRAEGLAPLSRREALKHIGEPAQTGTSSTAPTA